MATTTGSTHKETSMTKLEQERRLLTLAKSLGAGIRFGPPGNSRAGLDNYGRPWVLLDPTRTADDTYFGGLHELGHIALGHPRDNALARESALAHSGGPVTSRLLEAEADAWLWALDHAGCAPDAALDYMRGALGSYKRDHHGPEPLSYKVLRGRLA